ncbi:MAG: pentapeptide repeat-containing protein, partial [Thermoproteota archaeon]|nr:pentapeptide repeat-containing protein [Thermoproteota archaeon]
MKECNLANADLTKANMMWANLQGSNLTGCIVSKTIFVEANLTNAKTENVDKSLVYLKYAKLQGTSWK